MSVAAYTQIDWEVPWPTAYGVHIYIQPRTLLWRGYDTRYARVSDRPAYYGSRATASDYAKIPHRKLGLFATTKPLRLLDYRFMKAILRELFETNKANSGKKDAVLNTTIAFGLSSLYHQIALMSIRYRDIVLPGLEHLKRTYSKDALIEQEGVRVGETNNDGYVMSFLKELFRDVADGFVAPRMSTQFHVEKHETLNPEVILFNPEKAGIVYLPAMPRTIEHVPFTSIVHASCSFVSVDAEDMKLTFGMVGGGSSEPILPAYEQFHESVHLEDETAKAIERRATKHGKLWRERIRSFVAPHPTYPVSPW